MAVVPARRGRRGTAGVFVREAGRPVPVGRGAAGVRGEIDRQRPLHRGHLVADVYGQRDRDGDGGGVVRELRDLDVRRGERSLDQGVRGADHRGDDRAERRRVRAGGRVRRR